MLVGNDHRGRGIATGFAEVVEGRIRFLDMITCRNLKRHIKEPLQVMLLGPVSIAFKQNDHQDAVLFHIQIGVEIALLSNMIKNHFHV
jgi:hypothetical protein